MLAIETPPLSERPRDVARRQSLQPIFVPNQAEASATPIFLVHEILGGIDCYRLLSEALGTDQPVYAFRQPVSKREFGIVELASLYLRELLDFQPTGRRILGGYSFGGVIAFEMAQQLRARGEDVDLVLMFDTWVPGFDRWPKLSERASIFLKNSGGGGWSYILRKIHDKWNYWKRISTRGAMHRAGSICDWFGLEYPGPIRASRAEVANRKALTGYKPTEYDGRILLMVSRDTAQALSQRGDPTLGWGEVAGAGLEMCTVASDHTNLLKEDSVHQVVRLLQERSAPTVSEVE